MAMAPDMNRRALLLGAATVSLAVTPLQAEVDFGGTAQLRQVISETTSGGFGTTGYLETALTANLNVDTQRLNGQLVAIGSRRFEEFGTLRRKYRLGGTAAFDANLVDDRLFVGFGGQARQDDRDQRGFAGQNVDAVNGNQVQVYSAYAAPRFTQPLGGDYRFDAGYRIGITTVDGIDSNPLTSGTNIGLDGRGATGRGLTDSLSQSANISIGSTPRQHRLGIRALGSWTHEAIDEQDQRYRSYSASLEGSYRLDRKLTLTLRGGYEDIINKQDSILYDDDGFPVLGPDGDFVVDPANPRRTAFERSGAFGTAGFIYTPSRRTSVSFTGGYRYGDPNFNLSASFQPTPRTRVYANYNEGISSFSRLLTQSLNGEIFDVSQVGGSAQIFESSQCLVDGVTGCALDFTQSITPATFRSRVGSVGVNFSKDRVNANAAIFYNRRNYVDVQQLQTAADPDISERFTGSDTSFGLRGGASLALQDQQTVGLYAGISRNDYVLSQDRQDMFYNASATYSRGLGSKVFVTGRASASFRQANGAGAGDSENFSGSVGIGYRF
ncbi:MAG: hypothetical protein WA979_05080 [Pacificimonas sp.]